MKTARLVIIAVGLVLTQAVVAQGTTREPVAFEIEQQPLAGALNAFSKQAGLQVIQRDEHVSTEGLMAPRVYGALMPGEALRRLLANSGLWYEFINERTVRITASTSRGQVDAQGSVDEATLRLVQTFPSEGERRGEDGKQQTVAKDAEDPERGGIPEILVTGSKVRTLNTDIRRTEDDAQPYMIFDREQIASSGAANIEEFFRNELTMATTIIMAGQTESFGNRSRINLRGLGTDETLILIDGRRVVGFNFDGTPNQPDINGIPMAAIERIEVLPTTAAGIFGGGATGGAINIVLRRDYVGIESRLTYGNTFESDATTRRADLSTGFSLEGGKTDVFISASYSDANPLLIQERNLAQRGRLHILANHGNDPQALNTSGFIPPLGATPNIRSRDGTNLTLDNGTPLNSPITFVPEGYAGAATDQGAALAANAGRYNLDLAPTAQARGGARHGLLSAPEVKSIMTTLRRELTPRIQAFLELQGSESSTEYSVNYADPRVIIPGDAPNNPFQQRIVVRVPTVGMDDATSSKAQDLRAVSGVIAQLPREWQIALDLTWNRSRSSYTQGRSLSPDMESAVNNGSIDVLRDIVQSPAAWEAEIPNSQSPGDMKLYNAALRLGGMLPWSLLGGKPTLSALVEHREESVGEVITVCPSCGEPFLYPARSQTVDSVYFETQVPVVSSESRRTGLNLLELQLSVRGDNYTVTGASDGVPVNDLGAIVRTTNRNSSIDPTVGLRYQPVVGLMFRASYGTGYLPPSMGQLVPQPPFPLPLGAFGMTDPLRGDEPVGNDVQWTQGGNPDLTSEESESWSAGVVLNPGAIEGLRIAADWTRISKRDNIALPPALRSPGDFGRFITLFPERVTRGPPVDGFSVGRITEVDASLLNVSRMRVEALDLALDYQLATGRLGEMDLSMRATRLIDLESQLVPDVPVVDELGVQQTFNLSGGLKWKVNASLNWGYQGWSLGWRTRFMDSYFFNPEHALNPNQGAASIPSQMYHDFYGSYRFAQGSTSNVLASTEIRFGVNNVLNKEPPVDVVSVSSVMYSTLGDPRLANYYLSVSKHFGW